jgi:hypothetical protein
MGDLDDCSGTERITRRILARLCPFCTTYRVTYRVIREEGGGRVIWRAGWSHLEVRGAACTDGVPADLGLAQP